MTEHHRSAHLVCISPTRAPKLLACPRRIAYEQTSTLDGAPPPRNGAAHLGTAIHRTIELVLKTDNLTLDAAWLIACDEEIVAGLDPRTLPDARRALLRLQRRMPDLLALITECGARRDALRHEIELRSADGLIEGRLDLLILGDLPYVVDYKTGFALLDGEPVDQYLRQLAVYAWLIEREHKLDVTESALFSLRDGIVKVDTSRSKRESAVEEILSALQAFNERVPGPQPATPSDEGCSFCPFIGKCDEAWAAYHDGVIERLGYGTAITAVATDDVMTASNGLASIPIRFTHGLDVIEGLIYDVPGWIASRLTRGSRFRSWGLGSRSQQPLTFNWRQGSSRLVCLD